MFEAYKMKEWVARRLPGFRKAWRDKAASGKPDFVADILADQLPSTLAATIVRVEPPSLMSDNEDWAHYQSLACDHNLPLPFENIVLEVPNIRRLGLGDIADNMLVHLMPFTSEGETSEEPVKFFQDDYLCVWITFFDRHRPWSLYPFVYGEIKVEGDRIAHRFLAFRGGLSDEPQPLEREFSHALASMIAGLLGYLLTCRAEPHKVATMRRAMMKHHHPKRDEYRVAVIDPEKLRAYEKKEPVGTHASPIPHDRRGHLRRLASGKEVWVRSCRVNAGHEGSLVKDYLIKGTDMETSRDGRQGLPSLPSAQGLHSPSQSPQGRSVGRGEPAGPAGAGAS